MNLARFSKPSRYINNEINSIHKRSPIRVALAFPDIYDVGMSHLGLKILYHIINNIPYASAERVYSPWPDMESEMKRLNLPLTSLETKTPIRDFDIVGFSLQYELSYPTVLNMLDLSGIPVRSVERDNNDPIIIAGGPCSLNPVPMAPFIDAFLIGEAEEAIGEMVDAVFQTRNKREDTLKALAGIEGVFVPSLQGLSLKDFTKKGGLIKRRYIKDLDSSPYPLSPVVPYTPVVHDRITIEVSRGCPRGCRFCEAGMIYRPYRERSEQRIIEIAEASLRNTGYEEISLSSLSTGDYCNLIHLMKGINSRFSKKIVSLSLSSLRVASVNRDILREIKAVRKTGFTMAPEAATERLRRIINKDFNDEDYERALHALFSEGWENLKLYFMIGLPEEKDEDIEAIPEMALRAIKIAKRYSRRFVNISVTVSPFVPKPHTPFQWLSQDSIGHIKEKLDYLKERFRKKGIGYKGHDPQASLLEAVLSRGDSSISLLIEEAWKRGCRLDAWTEFFDFRKWSEAAESSGIDLYCYAKRRFDINESLPWDFIDSGVRKEFLLKELQRAFSEEMTPECRDKCYGCGLGCTHMDKDLKVQDTGFQIQDKSISKIDQSLMPDYNSPKSVRLRVEFQKGGIMRYLSHRELMTAIIRALRRTDIPVLYSHGFHPSPKLSFGPPLNVGVSGLKEYFDMEIAADCATLNIKEILNKELPEGIRINDTKPVSKSLPSLDSFIKRYEYVIICQDTETLEAVIRDFTEKSNLLVEPVCVPRTGRRERKDRVKRSVDLKKMVESLERIDRDRIRLVLVDREEKVRLNEIIMALFRRTRVGDLEGLPTQIDIIRIGLYGWDLSRNEWVQP